LTVAINAVHETHRHLLPKVAAFRGLLRENLAPERKT